MSNTEQDYEPQRKWEWNGFSVELYRLPHDWHMNYIIFWKRPGERDSRYESYLRFVDAHKGFDKLRQHCKNQWLDGVRGNAS